LAALKGIDELQGATNSRRLIAFPQDKASYLF